MSNPKRMSAERIAHFREAHGRSLLSSKVVGELFEHIDAIEAALSGLEGVRGALEKIVAWEMPPSGRFWDKNETDPMSYGAAFGSNGERDVIKSIARSALSQLDQLEAAG